MTKERFPISAPRTVENLESLSIEKNALRYAAGYYKKLQSLSILTRKSCCCAWMIWCNVRQRVQKQNSQKIGLGGLIYVTSEVYMVICAMEIELRPHLQSDLSQLTHFKQNALD